MAIQYMNQMLLAGWMIEAWQKEFKTEMDPSDGQWFTNGPGNTRMGLYGALVDTLASDLVYEESSKVFSPHQNTVDTAILDNTNGLSPEATVTLSYTYTNSSSSTHNVSNAIKSGIQQSIEVSAKFGGTGVKSTTSFSFDYTYSWSDSKSKSESTSQTFSHALPMKVPKGRIYQAQLMCNTNNLTIPYKALVKLSGKSAANFPGPTRGTKHHEIDAGTLCSWINKHGTAGAQSYLFGVDPKDPSQGYFALNGTMTATDTTNFSAHIVDITHSSLLGVARSASLGEHSGELLEVFDLK